MNVLKFYVYWQGELAAGIRPGSEEVEIHYKYGPLGTEEIEFWRVCVQESFDGAIVLTEAESAAQRENEPCSECGQTKTHQNHWAPFGWHNCEAAQAVK